MRLAFALAAIVAAPLAFADVLPPPEDITDVQQQLVGVWQQDAPAGLGHGDGLETMFIAKDRYTIVGFSGMDGLHIYSIGEIGGDYTADRVSATEIKVTLSMGMASPGVTPPTEIRDFKFDSPDHVTILRQGRMSAEVGYTRITPKHAQ